MKNTQKNRKLKVYILSICIIFSLILILILLPGKKSGEINNYYSQEDYIPGKNESGNPDRESDDTGKNTENKITQTKPVTKEIKHIALVIDDVGYNLDNLDYFLKFPGPVTFAVLPNLQYSREAAQKINAAGKEVIVHMPMEALNSNLDHGPGAIFTDMTDEEIVKLLKQALNSVPYAVGMNNHMGSKATADLRVMNIIINFTELNDLFFLDSLTNPESVSGMVSEINKIPVLKRNIFLDVKNDKESVKNQYIKGLEITENTDPVILIGHIQNIEVINVLNDMYPGFKEKGIELKYLSELVNID
jgi:polysaccharide deacetylase 2 family uncharacterized protein YibQ